nr:NADH dehydrogenase subunit 6 [Asicimbex sp. CSCS-Hym-MC0132]
MSKMLMFMLMINSMIFILCKTPLSMGLILLIQTTLISLNSGLLTMTFWYSYILFMIMLGGMLILFIYITSLTSNLKFKFNKKFFIIMLLILSMIYLLNLNFKFNIYNLNFMNLEMETNYYFKLSLKKMFYLPNYKILLIMINYLLLTLFIVVKIININKGPLRKI